MKRAVSISIGSSKRNKTIEIELLGEKVLLERIGTEPFEVKNGDRIAQMIFKNVVRVKWQEVDRLPETGRGAGGFGSTGRR